MCPVDNNSPSMSKEDILFCGELTSARKLSDKYGVAAHTIRERLRRDGKVMYESGRVYVCDERIVRPPKRTSTPRPPRKGFDVSRYAPNVDGDDDAMCIAGESQKWLGTSIGTTAWQPHSQIGTVYENLHPREST